MFQKVIDSEVALVLTMPIYTQNLFELTQKNKKHLSPWFPWVEDIKQLNDTKAFILSKLQALAKEEALHCLIFYQNRLAGVCDLHNISKKHQKAFIGYWIDKDLQGRKIAKRALKGLIDIAFDDLGLKKLTILAQKENIKSQKLAESLKFKQKALLESHLFINGSFRDFYLYERIN